MESNRAVTLQCEMPEHSASQPENLIREWLFRFGVNYNKDVAPILPLWREAFGGMKPEVLETLFRQALKAYKFFPTVAEILAPVNSAGESVCEDEWQGLLSYIEQWYSPDAVFSGTPRLPEDIDHAARAAGGLGFLFNCSREDLQWAKKRFTEDLSRTRESGGIASLLPGASLPVLLERARAEYTPKLPAPQSSSTSNAPPVSAKLEQRILSAEDESKRRAMLQEQAKAILEKYPSSGSTA